jgi:hypothetical protein
MRTRAALSFLVWLVPLAAQEPPKVVALSPGLLACDVDAATTKTLTVTFDQPMYNTGWSFCGGGPNFPKFVGKPQWKDEKTVLVEVALEPDHDYSLGLNGPTAHNFQSRKGVALVPVQWNFSTLPKVLPDPKEQRPRNEKAFGKLVEALDGAYSYRDLRVRDWDKRVAAAKPALLGARTDKAFAGATAALLKPTEDIHLSVHCGQSELPTGTRSVDTLWRRELLDQYFKVEEAGKNAWCGRSDDGIGYLVVKGWDGSVNLDAIEQALAGLRGCKAMVVDARPNCGGDELMARRIAAWFVDGKKVYAKNRIRERPGKDGFGPVLERAVTGNADPHKRIACPIAVLTSRYVMSSNESFVMMLQQARACTVIGQPTYGSSGCPKPHDLGNGVTVLMPSWQDLRLDGTCFEGEGLKPDVLVECTGEQMAPKDPILEKALAILRGKVGK